MHVFSMDHSSCFPYIHSYHCKLTILNYLDLSVVSCFKTLAGMPSFAFPYNYLFLCLSSHQPLSIQNAECVHFPFIFLSFLLKYSCHTILCQFQGYSLVIQRLNKLQMISTLSSNHLSPYEVITVLLTISRKLYIISSCDLFQNWKFVPLNFIHVSHPSSTLLPSVSMSLFCSILLGCLFFFRFHI